MGPSRLKSAHGRQGARRGVFFYFLVALGVVLLRRFRFPRSALLFLFLVAPGVVFFVGGFVKCWLRRFAGPFGDAAVGEATAPGIKRRECKTQCVLHFINIIA